MRPDEKELMLEDTGFFPGAIA